MHYSRAAISNLASVYGFWGILVKKWNALFQHI